MPDYLNEFYIIAIAHIFAVMSPGPDFALITRQSIMYGRKNAIYTSIGIASGIIVHIVYIIFGFNLLSSNQFLFNAIRILSSVYLFYLGLSSILSTKNIDFSDIKKDKNTISSFIQSYKVGFITNVLNVKAILFFISLYASINAQTSNNVLFLYGLWMSIITCFWFIFLSYSFTGKYMKSFTTKYYYYLNKIMGLVLIYISIKIYLNY